MQLKLFLLPVKNLSAAEAEMNAFLRSHRVLAVKKEFVSDGENSFWTFCVEYLDGGAPSASSLGGKLPKVDYKEVLKPEEFEVFSRLREWRKAVADKYFDSIDHATLRALLERKFKDPRLLSVFDRIIGSYSTAPGRGLPIGNLTSQHFANFYLDPLDRFFKETLRRGAYVRYMDDFVVWGASGRELGAACDQVREFLAAELKLTLKGNTAINRTAFGMDFLGYRVFPETVRLARRSKLRFTQKLQQYEAAHWRGKWSELVLQQRMQALLAFLMPADSRTYRRHVLQHFGMAAKGLEPCESGRQLEQQRDQLPGGEPQQRQPDEQEQQHRLPFCPAPSSTRLPDGSRADPAAILSPARPLPGQRRNPKPPGASSLAGPDENSGQLLSHSIL